MYGDFSRFLGGLDGQYSGVLAQQGRLLLDAELNEQNAILLDYLRCLTTDLIGPFAGPLHHAGFAVKPVVRGRERVCRAVRLGEGRYYVYGLRCEAPAQHQPADEELWIGEHRAPFVVYLAVWEQAVSTTQAPQLTDPALSADVPDTTRRRQVRWRPMGGRELPGCEGDLTEQDPQSIIDAFEKYNADSDRRPTLAARAHFDDEPEPGPDSAPTPWGYRGVENQLYRVEVHHGGDRDDATFKWSRDNGSVEFGLENLKGPDGPGVRTATLRRVSYDSPREGLEIGDWVEFVDDHWSPFGAPEPLMQVTNPPPTTRQVWLQDASGDRDFDRERHPLLRRWDQHPPGEEYSGGIPVRHAYQEWFELEDGVHIRFEAAPARYERGDYWLIPARTATNGLLWPHSDEGRIPLAIPPNGPPRYLAPLALVRNVAAHEPVDLRRLFGHLPVEHIPSPPPSRRRSAGRGE
jgi:hypothetical protein